MTTEVAYANQHGDPVGTLTFRIFKFRPGTGRQRGDEPVDDSPRPERPRPRWNPDKVKVTLRFRGREMVHQELGMDVLDRVRDDVSKLSKVEQFPKLEGRQMTMVIAPI